MKDSIGEKNIRAGPLEEKRERPRGQAMPCGNRCSGKYFSQRLAIKYSTGEIFPLPRGIRTRLRSLTSRFHGAVDRGAQR